MQALVISTVAPLGTATDWQDLQERDQGRRAVGVCRWQGHRTLPTERMKWQFVSQPIIVSYLKRNGRVPNASELTL